jgi:lipopolysaccharide export system permease protein
VTSLEQIVSGRIGGRSIRFAPLGVHTRYMLAGYLRHTLMVFCALLAIALTIDIWPQFGLVADGGQPGILHAIWRVVRFEFLRTPDLLSPLVPFAIFLGVVWSEIAHTQSGERLLVWNSGHSPLHCLAPAIFLGLIIGTAQFVTDAYLGPAAMEVQMRERLGRNGQRLDRTHNSGSHWIASQDGLVRTEIVYGPPTVLRNLTIYKLDTHGRLTEVESALEARPIAGTDDWLLKNGHYWIGAIDASGSSRPATVTFDGIPGEELIPFAQQKASLKVSPQWLSELGIGSQYLSLSVLRMLSSVNADPLAKIDYRTRVQTIYADLLFPGVMAILAALLSIRAFPYRIAPRALIAVPFAGYLAHFANKAAVLMGSHGYIGPFFAAWTVPIAVLVVTVATIRLSTIPRKPRREAGWPTHTEP